MAYSSPPLPLFFLSCGWCSSLCTFVQPNITKKSHDHGYEIDGNHCRIALGDNPLISRPEIHEDDEIYEDKTIGFFVTRTTQEGERVDFYTIPAARVEHFIRYPTVIMECKQWNSQDNKPEVYFFPMSSKESVSKDWPGLFEKWTNPDHLNGRYDIKAYLTETTTSVAEESISDREKPSTKHTGNGRGSGRTNVNRIGRQPFLHTRGAISLDPRNCPAEGDVELEDTVDQRHDPEHAHSS